MRLPSEWFAALILLGLPITASAGGAFEVEIGNAVIFDIRWDRRHYDGTPGFPGTVLWRYNPVGEPEYLNRAEVLDTLRSGFRVWENLDPGTEGVPLLPRVSYDGETDAVFKTFDGVNCVSWQNPLRTDAFGQAIHTVIIGGSLTTIADENGRTVFRLPDLIIHEAGHWYGLAHSPVGVPTFVTTDDATMVSFDSTIAARSPHPDDVAAFLRLYARVNGVPPT